MSLRIHVLYPAIINQGTLRLIESKVTVAVVFREKLNKNHDRN